MGEGIHECGLREVGLRDLAGETVYEWETPIQLFVKPDICATGDQSVKNDFGSQDFAACSAF
jgi:hypothetical protein